MACVFCEQISEVGREVVCYGCGRRSRICADCLGELRAHLPEELAAWLASWARVHARHGARQIAR